MRYKPTKNNLAIQLTPAEIPECVQRTTAYLVPRFTRKVYLLAEPAELFSTFQPDITVLKAGQEPSNFLSSFRLLLRPGELVVVSSRENPFTKEQWRELAGILAT
jgi:hypothetical protein